MRLGVIGSRGYPSTYGGYETFVRELVPRAIEAGHEVVVYCRAGAGPRTSWVEGAECRRTRGVDTRHLSTLTFGLSSCWDARRRALDAALVVNCANGYWLPLLRSAGVPVALNVDGLEWERAKWNRAGRAVFRGGAALSARHASCLVSDSRAVAAVWERLFDVRPAYIPYGADLLADEGFDELESIGIPPGGYVLTVARLVPENNVSIAIDGVELLDRIERPLHVIVGSSGSGGATEARLRALAERRDDLVWLGHVSNQRLLRQLFRNASVYVHGHSVGGTNPALLQALGAGAPVLAYDVPFNREVIGELDVYFRSAAELGAGLSRLLGSSALREKLADSGRATVRERYQWPDVCRRYLELLSGLAEQPGSATARAGIA